MEARRAVRRIAVVIAVYLAVSVALGIFIAEATLHPGRRSVSSGDLVHAHDLATSLRAELSDATVTVIDGTSLRGWLLRPQQPNGDAVILLHGLSDNRLGMIGYAELLLRDNYTVLMIDARAHGQSEGLLATYGILESRDVHSWYEWLHDTQHPRCIFGFGESMGAAQLLQSVRESRFCSIAVESPFSNFREIGYDRVGQFFHTGPWLGRTILRPVIDFAFVYARWKYNLDMESISPESAIVGASMPIFLIHGREDRNIPFRHAQRIIARNPHVVLWEVPNTDHCGAISTHPEEFALRLLTFFHSP